MEYITIKVNINETMSKRKLRLQDFFLKGKGKI
jgi:hypothetical protein